MKVYVAGPYSGGYIPYNVKNAVDAAEQLAQAGHYAYIPHLSMYWDMFYPHPYDFWMALDDAFLRVCEAMIRLPGESSGADKEEKVAKSLGIPVLWR